MKIGQRSVSNARIGFRNFAGLEGPYNQPGERSFAVFFDEDTANKWYEEGWNIKYPKPRQTTMDEEDIREPYLSVSVTFRNFPPKVVLITNDKPTIIGEEEVGMLDWAEIENVDLVIRPYNWEVNGNTGIKAYLKAIYVTIASDEFSAKYGV